MLGRLIAPVLRWIGAAEPARTPGPGGDFWYQAAAQSGLTVTPTTVEGVMAQATAYSCVRVLADSVGSLPLHIYRRQVRGGKEKATDHPLYPVLHARPNVWQTSLQWRQQLMIGVALRGSVAGMIKPGATGRVGELVPLDPARCRWAQLEDGQIAVEYRTRKGERTILLQDELLRLDGLSTDGVQGLSVINAARQSLELTAAMEQHGARLFANGARPGGVLEVPGKLSDDARTNLRESWAALHQGSQNAGRVAILEEGLKWSTVAMNAEDAQFLQSRQFQVAEICRWFRVPPHMVMDLSRATFSNIEHQSIDFVVHTLRSWLVMWEQSISRDLLPGDQYFAEFSIDGLLRGDAQARTAVYRSGLNDGWMTPNEVRALENLNPVEGGDTLRTPLNMAPVGQAPTRPEPTQVAQVSQTPHVDLEPSRIEGPSEHAARLAALELASAERVISAEVKAIARLAKREDAEERIAAFYADHAEFVARVCVMPVEGARAYVDRQRELAIGALRDGGIDGLLARWSDGRAAELAAAMREHLR